MADVPTTQDRYDVLVHFKMVRRSDGLVSCDAPVSYQDMSYFSATMMERQLIELQLRLNDYAIGRVKAESGEGPPAHSNAGGKKK